MTRTQYRLTINNRTYDPTSTPPDNWPQLAHFARERGVGVRLEKRDSFGYDALFHAGLRDPHTGANPAGWLIVPGQLLASPWQIVAEVPADVRTIGGIIGR